MMVAMTHLSFPPASATAACQARYDGAKDCDNAADDGLEDGTDAGDDGHYDAADGIDDGFNLLFLLVAMEEGEIRGN